MNSSNRRQHWVPRVYLRGFAADGRLRVFARLLGKAGARQFETSTVNVANERDLYTVTTERGRDTSFDDRLRTEVEDNIPEILAPLGLGRQLSEAERLALVRLAAVQDWRRPTSIRGISEAIERVHHISASLYREHQPGITESEIQDRLRENWGPTGLTGDHALDPKNLALGVLEDPTLNFTGQFAGMCMCVVESAAHSFVTSDHPVVFHDPQVMRPHPLHGLDRSSSTVEVTFPLTHRYALVMTRLPIVPYAYASKVGVTLINSRTAYGSASQVFCLPVSDRKARQRQRNDIFRQFGALSLAQLLVPDHDALRINPLVRELLGKERARLRILAEAFDDRVLEPQA